MAEIVIRFWGVRGSIPCPGDRWRRYGGNTSCIEVRCVPTAPEPETLLVLDGGTGLRLLGETLPLPLGAHLLLTHTHVDHIQGIPFFRPLYDAGSTIRIGAGHLQRTRSIRDALGTYMASPLFPVPPDVFDATVDWWDFAAGDLLELSSSLRVRTAPLNHPDGATGYRVEFGGRSFCYVTDTEHVPGAPDERILALIRGADVVAYDCSYTDAELPQYRGWGHSTWEEAVRLCDAAGVGTLVIFHHDPRRTDDRLDALAEEAARVRPGTVVAAEGLEISLADDGSTRIRPPTR